MGPNEAYAMCRWTLYLTVVDSLAPLPINNNNNISVVFTYFSFVYMPSFVTFLYHIANKIQLYTEKVQEQKKTKNTLTQQNFCNAHEINKIIKAR